MNIGSPQWKNLIVEGAAQLGVAVDGPQVDQMAVHAQELLAWNRRTNLTAITDPVEMAVKHFLDSLAGLDRIPPGARLLDIGSGGGFPGLPLKIMRPGQPMILVDGIRRKITFIKHVIRSLRLDRIQAIHTRAEVLAHGMDESAGFDVITCRALAGLEAIIGLALPLLAADGILVLYKGPGEMTSEAPGHEFQVNTHAYRLPYLNDDRRLIVMRRQQYRGSLKSSGVDKV